MDRKSTLLVAACLIFSIIGWLRLEFPGRVHAEDADAKQPGRPTRVALVDLGKVYNQSNDFATEKRALVERIKGVESEGKVMYDELVAQRKELAQLEEGSDAHKDLAAAIKKNTKAMEEFSKRAQREMSANEADLYAKTYAIIREEVQRHAEVNGIDLVMRFNLFDADSNKKKEPKEILQSLNATIVYQSQLDITDAIVEAVNHR